MKQFVLSSGSNREERDAGGNIIRRFFSLGQKISGTSYFYTRCRPNSVTEMTDGIGVVQAQYNFDSFGRSMKLQGSLEADFQYAGYYMHARSGLNLPVFRAYSARLGRWISRDPIEEKGGMNLYGYEANVPTAFSDPSGLWKPGDPVTDWSNFQSFTETFMGMNSITRNSDYGKCIYNLLHHSI